MLRCGRDGDYTYFIKYDGSIDVNPTEYYVPGKVVESSPIYFTAKGVSKSDVVEKVQPASVSTLSLRTHGYHEEYYQPTLYNVPIVDTYVGPQNINHMSKFYSVNNLPLVGNVNPINNIQLTNNVNPFSYVQHVSNGNPGSNSQFVSNVNPINNFQIFGDICPVNNIQPVGNVNPVNNIQSGNVKLFEEITNCVSNRIHPLKVIPDPYIPVIPRRIHISPLHPSTVFVVNKNKFGGIRTPVLKGVIFPKLTYDEIVFKLSPIFVDFLSYFSYEVRRLFVLLPRFVQKALVEHYSVAKISQFPHVAFVFFEMCVRAGKFTISEVNPSLEILICQAILQAREEGLLKIFPAQPILPQGLANGPDCGAEEVLAAVPLIYRVLNPSVTFDSSMMNGSIQEGTPSMSITPAMSHTLAAQAEKNPEALWATVMARKGPESEPHWNLLVEAVERMSIATAYAVMNSFVASSDTSVLSQVGEALVSSVSVPNNGSINPVMNDHIMQDIFWDVMNAKPDKTGAGV